MTWRSRLANGISSLLPSKPQYSSSSASRVTPRYDLNQTKMLFETAYGGLSQPVFGPELATVGAYSREGYTSKTFDTPAIPFRIQAQTLQLDEDAQMNLIDQVSKITGGEHYVKAQTDGLIGHFENITWDLQFDTLDAEIVGEALFYGNSIWKPRMGIYNVTKYEDLLHIPISSFQRIWWDRQRIGYKYEFRGAEYQGYHNPGEIIHFTWNKIDASVIGTGYGTSLNAPRRFEMVTGGGLKEYQLPSIIDRKLSTYHNMQMAEQKYITANVYVDESGSEDNRRELQNIVSNREVGQDIVAGSGLKIEELGSQKRNFNAEQFMDITKAPLMTAMNNFRGKEAGTSQHSYANAKESRKEDEIGLSAFVTSIKQQITEKLIKPIYLSHPYYDPNFAAGIIPVPWKDSGFEFNFGEVEKRDIPVDQLIKLIELFMNAPIPKDPTLVFDLFEQAGLAIKKEHRVELENQFNDPTGMMAQNAAGVQQFNYLPSADIGGGPFVQNQQPMMGNYQYSWNNQRMGEPPNTNPTYDAMVRDVRGTQVPTEVPYPRNGFSPQPSKKSQYWNAGQYEGNPY